MLILTFLYFGWVEHHFYWIDCPRSHWIPRYPDHTHSHRFFIPPPYRKLCERRVAKSCSDGAASGRGQPKKWDMGIVTHQSQWGFRPWGFWATRKPWELTSNGDFAGCQTCNMEVDIFGVGKKDSMRYSQYCWIPTIP